MSERGDEGTVPTFYVDAVQVAAQPFTIQLLLGAVDMNGAVTPAVHLTMNPAFARQLAALLVGATDEPTT